MKILLWILAGLIVIAIAPSVTSVNVGLCIKLLIGAIVLSAILLLISFTLGAYERKN